MTESGTGNPFPIAIGSKNRLSDARTGKVVGKDRIDQNINIFEDISSIDPFLVIGGGRGNGKIVALIPVRRKQGFLVVEKWNGDLGIALPFFRVFVIIRIILGERRK